MTKPVTCRDDVAAGTTPPTRREYARKLWEREGWDEPRDEEQERLYVLFWLGEAYGEGDDGGLDSRWYPRNWTRPQRWVERLVRS